MPAIRDFVLIAKMQRGHAHPVWRFKNIKGTRGGVVVRWDSAISIVGQTSFQTVYKYITSEIIVWMLFSMENWYFQKPASATTVIGNCLARQFPVHGCRLCGFYKCLFFYNVNIPICFLHVDVPRQTDAFICLSHLFFGAILFIQILYLEYEMAFSACVIIFYTFFGRWWSFSMILAPVVENIENGASDGHFRWSWRLWPRMVQIELLIIIFADPGACGWKNWKSSFWLSFSLILAPVAENVENRASDNHFRWFWRLLPKMSKIGLLTPVAENGENRASDDHFHWSWRLLSKMLKIELLIVTFAKKINYNM